MLALVLSALRVRRVQASALLLLTFLAAGSAAAAPWYVLASAEAVAAASVDDARPADRIVEVRRQGPVTGGIEAGATELARTLDERIGLPGFTAMTGAVLTGRALAGEPTPEERRAGTARQATPPLVYRSAACDKVVVDGACPTGPDEAMISSRTATGLRVAVGDTLTYESADLPAPAILRVTAIYRAARTSDPFWAPSGMVATEAGAPGAGADRAIPVDDAILISASGMEALRPSSVVYAADLVATGPLFVVNQPAAVLERLDNVSADLTRTGYTFTGDLEDLARRIENDQRLIYLGVPTGAAQLLVLCWFALYLAVKYTGDERRPDIGLLKLRGVRRPRIWALTAGQSVVPMLLGAAVGVVVGSAAGRLVGGEISQPDVVTLAAALAVAGATLAVLGALVTALVAERRALASPVVDLLRQIPARRRAWRDVADLLAVAAAVAALYQVRGAATGVALVAPGLAALAVALVVARLVVYVAASAGPEALRSGRLGLTLTSVYLARRPGVHRLCALLIVAVALVGTAVLAWDAGTRTARARAEVEHGAERVLTVRASNRAHLLEAVRTADPGGSTAMAAVQFQPVGDRPGVLLVDAPRLAAVARWRPEYGGRSAAQAAEALRPGGEATSVRVDGGRVAIEASVRVAARIGDRRAYLEMVFAAGAGERVRALVGPMTSGRQRMTADVPACAKAPHCRLVAINVLRSDNGGQAFFAMNSGTVVTLHRLDSLGPDRTVVDEKAFADRVRWRPTTDTAPPNLALTTAGSGLELSVLPPQPTDGPPPRADPGVYPVDAPAPVPALATGSFRPERAGDPRVLLGDVSVPVQVVETVKLLPRLGDSGVLVDLEYADRAGADFGGGELMQVWLAPGAPAALLDRLRAARLEILDDETIADVLAGYLRLGPPVALRFQLGAAAVGLLLAAGAVAVVAAVERRPRTAELAALRAQGAPVRLTRRAAAGGYLVLLGVSLLVGAATAVGVRAYVGDLVPFFADRWALVDTGPVPDAYLVGLAVAIVLVTLGGVGALATYQLVRRVR